jgi:hypothetical protein
VQCDLSTLSGIVEGQKEEVPPELSLPCGETVWWEDSSRVLTWVPQQVDLRFVIQHSGLSREAEQPTGRGQAGPIE